MINRDIFHIRKNGKMQKRGKINLIGRLQLSTERSREEDNQSIVQLRILRVQVRHIIFFFFNKAVRHRKISIDVYLSKSDHNNEQFSSAHFSFYLLQEAIIKILKMRKKITNAQLQTELVDILKNMFLPSKKMIKEQIEWLIEHKYIRRHDDDINTFVYMA